MFKLYPRCRKVSFRIGLSEVVFDVPLLTKTLHKGVQELIHFIREPTWMVPPRLQSLSLLKAVGVLAQIEMDDEGRFTPEQIRRFEADHDFYLRFIKAVEEQVNSNFSIVSNRHHPTP